jgi:hypothetical protein
MVRRRSTVRFRNGAPAQPVISNAAFQDQETKFQDQEINAALTGLDGATQPDKKGSLACGYLWVGRCASPEHGEWGPLHLTAANVSRATPADLAAAGFHEVELCAFPELAHQAGPDSRLSASRCLIDR